MKILVTGSRGFIGQAVGHEAARRGDTVLGLSRSAQPPPGWPGRHYCVDVIDDDLADIVTSFAPDAIIHAAGPASVGESFHAPASTLKASLLSWINVLDALRRSGVPSRALLISSAAVYGQPDRLPVAEGEVRRPISPYGYHKVMCEIAAQEYAACFGIDAVACRLFSVVGPGQRRLLAWEIYRQVAAPDIDEVVLAGSPDSARDYLHVRDVARGLLALVAMPSVPSVVNIASGECHTVGSVVDLITTLCGSEKPTRFLRQQVSGDPDRWQADVSLLGRLVDWHPLDLAAALADCVQAWGS
jgi:UDP-glucose 4-epimerase